MSFSWWVKDKTGSDLLAKHGINSQMLWLGANSYECTRSMYSVNELRSAWSSFRYKEKCEDAARDAVMEIQKLARQNKFCLIPRHCKTCTCPTVKPDGWSVEEIDKLLSVDPSEVWRAGGGW